PDVSAVRFSKLTVIYSVLAANDETGSAGRWGISDVELIHIRSTTGAEVRGGDRDGRRDARWAHGEDVWAAPVLLHDKDVSSVRVGEPVDAQGMPHVV